jgi:hypothetical protein
MFVDAIGGDEAGPVYILRLWAHCQRRKAWVFDNLPSSALKAICRFPGPAEDLESGLIAAGFLAREKNGKVTVLNWDEYNASLIANWSNGGKGGRPPKPSGNPPETHGFSTEQPTENPRETDRRRLDRSSSSSTRARGRKRGPEPKPAAGDADWLKLRDAWNAGQGQPWGSPKPPSGLADRLAEPGWLDDMLVAILRIPRMRYYRASPPTLAQAIKPGWAERANGGGYDDLSPAKHRSSDDRPPVKVDPAFEAAAKATLAKREAERKAEHARLDARAAERERRNGVAPIGDVIGRKIPARAAT